MQADLVALGGLVFDEDVAHCVSAANDSVNLAGALVELAGGDPAKPVLDRLHLG